MSVTIATPQQPSTWWQRLTGTEPKTVVRESSTTTISSVPGGSFSIGGALRNGAIGAALAGAVGGVSLLGKIALPVIGKVATVGGLARLAGVGGALGVATLAAPWIAEKVRYSPSARAAVTGAAIGAAASLVVPFVGVGVGAAVGAGVGLLWHRRQMMPGGDGWFGQQHPGYPTYPGYTSHPGYVPVTPGYGYGQGYGHGHGQGYGYGAPVGAYPAAMSPYGYDQSMLPMQQTAATAPAPQQVMGRQPGVPARGAMPPQAAHMVMPVGGQQMVAPVAAPTPVNRAAAASARGSNAGAARALTFTDGVGNVRQVGTGTVLRPTTRPAISPTGLQGIVPGAAALAGYPQGGLPAQGGYAQLAMGARPTYAGDPALSGTGALQLPPIPARPTA